MFILPKKEVVKETLFIVSIILISYLCYKIGYMSGEGNMKLKAATIGVAIFNSIRTNLIEHNLSSEKVS